MKPDFDKILDTSNPHLVRRHKPLSEPTVKIKHERSKPVLVLESSSWGGGSFTCGLDENDIVLVCGWGDQCEPATLTPFETYGVDHDHGHSYSWTRTEYYVNLKSDTIPRFSSLKKMVEHDKVVIFALPEHVTEPMIGKLRDFAGTIMVTRQQIADHEEALAEYRKLEDVTAPVDYRKDLASTIDHIQELKEKLKALYATDLENI